jgi:hypothetical protein
MTWKAFANKWLILLHRWMGMAFCLLFISFFVSGIVMMYVRMPRLTNEERLLRLPDLDFSAARITPEEGLKNLAAEETPSAFRLTMFEGRPVYRVQIKQKWQTVFADTGEVLEEISAEHAIRIGRRFFPESDETITFIETLREPDQWTLSSAIRRLAPLHKIALNDKSGTQAYVSAQTGEVILKTDSSGRFWGYAGAVFHWIYFTPLRKHTEIWVWTIIALSFLGSLMCVFGIVVGLWRFSISKRFHKKKGGSMSPYQGEKRLHHWLGLVFGLFTFTWILSGLFSMNPFDWSPGTSATKSQIQAVRGGDLNFSKLGLLPFPAQKAFERSFRIKELEIVQFRGNMFYLGTEPPDELVQTNWSNTDFAGYLASETKMRQLFLNAETSEVLTAFSNEETELAATSAMPNAKIIESVWLDDYDSYYYSQDRKKNLPVLRVKFDDEKSTWLYLDPQQARIVLKHETLSRIERWVYQGLHSLDFPVFYQTRPLWDIVLVLLSLGGIWLSWTAVKLSLVRVRNRKF